MRVIKFRAWDGVKIIDTLLINFDKYGDALWLDGNLKGTEPHAWKEEGLMQFTGLKDKSGADIYFDDVVHVYGYGDLQVEGLSCLAILIDALAENDIGDILGNIHENPELIT